MSRYAYSMGKKTEGLIRELIALTACPSDLTVFDEEPGRPTGMRQEMLDFWEEIADKHGFSLYTEDLDAEIDRAGDVGPNDVELLTKQRDETAKLIAAARDEYVALTSRFFRMRVATDGEWGKHYTSKGTDRKSIIKRTAGGRKEEGSLFYPEVTREMLLRVLWDVLEVRWRDLLDTPHVRLWVDVMERIGASAGEETHLICFDLDFSTPLAHAFPVLRKDKESDEDTDPWLNTDVLQGMVTPTRVR